jgi:hypothetical protein
MATGLLAGPSPATAAAPITFGYSTGSRCVAGAKPATGRITLRLLAPNGTLRATRTSPTASAPLGGYEVCFDVVPRPGDRIRAVRGSVRRTITLPTLTAAVDRVTDVVSGKGPAGRRLTVRTRHCTLGSACDPDVVRSVTVNRKGRYHRDLTSAVDLRGMDIAFVRFGTSAGDEFQARATAPFFQVGTPDRVAAYCAPGTRTVRLRRADGRERASATFRSPLGCTTDTLASLPRRFKRNGSVIAPATGNIIRSDIATDARMVWPGPSLGIGNGSMTGKCLANAPYVVYMRRPTEPGMFFTLAEGTSSADGLFQRAYDTTLLPGDRIRLLCATPAGDQLVHDRTFGFT